MSTAHFAAPFQRMAAAMASAAAVRPAADGSGCPMTSRSNGKTAAIVPGVSP